MVIFMHALSKFFLACKRRGVPRKRDVSEENIASIFRVWELGKPLADSSLCFLLDTEYGSKLFSETSDFLDTSTQNTVTAVGTSIQQVSGSDV
jgi:hypothetical protein